MIVCIAATPAVDRLHEVKGPVVVGTIHRPSRVIAVAGGKGLNAARAAAALGADVRAVAPLGGAAGDWIEAQLHAAGIAVSRVVTGAEPRVCVSVAGEGQELTEFYEGAPELRSDEWDALLTAVRAAAVGAGWVTLSGSLPPGSPADGAEQLLRAARAAGARVALDSRDDDLRAGLRAAPDLVKINEHEARDVGFDVRALRPSNGVACITHGAAGLELAGDGFVLRAAPPTRGRYPVGCGDVTLGALVAARDAGADWRAAVASAVGAAAAAAEV
ncbi:PfkB family carbohydrate kinase, partial [Solirubrobacter phytolaccae]